MDQTSADKARIARQFIEAIPFSRALQMRLEEIGEGVAVISMPWSEMIVGDPTLSVVHGGAVSALMDTCGGAAVMSHPQALAGTATIDLRIDYMRAATSGQRITPGTSWACSADSERGAPRKATNTSRAM